MLFLFILLFNFSFSQICQYSNPTFPLDLSIIENSTFANINLYSFNNSTNKTFILEKSDNSLSFIGEFGNIILDGNTDFSLGESVIKYVFQCKNISLVSPSINKYWGSKQVEFEFIITCDILSRKDDIGQLDIKDKILISIPVVKIADNVVDNSLLNVVNTEGFDFINGNFPFEFTLNDFEFDKYFFNTDDLNQETLMYFYNGNNPIECNSNEIVTYIFFNDFIKISNDLYVKYTQLFSRLDLILDLTLYYLSKYESNITINRNFYYNEHFSEFQSTLLSYSINSSAIYSNINRLLLLLIIVYI